MLALNIIGDKLNKLGHVREQSKEMASENAILSIFSEVSHDISWTNFQEQKPLDPLK